jgi:sulfate-transporting ATPase
MITGSEKPNSGSFKVGETVKVSYVDQGRDLDGDKTVLQAIGEGNEILKLGSREMNTRAYISKFNFSGDDQKKKVSELSGGERNRVHLAKTLKSEGNVLLLDEPTNDLDIYTLRALENALLGYAGCAVVISHDRYFLDRIATHILAFEGDSVVTWFEGNYTDYKADLRSRIGDKADEPKKLTYKKLKRD